MSKKKGPNVRYTLRFELPDGQESPVVLREGHAMSVGRDRSNDLALPDSSMSRFHAVFSSNGQTLMLADQGSLNGVFVNGVRVDSLAMLKDSDVVNIGSTRVTVTSHCVSGATEAPDSQVTTTTLEAVPLPVTVLVVSMRESDEIAKRLKGQRYREFLQGFAAAAGNLITTHAGHLEAALGQSLVAVWSGKQPKRVAKQALSTAQLLRDVLSQSAPTPDHVDIAVAVSSGTALTQAEELTVEGTASNIALLGDPVREASALDTFIRRFFSEDGSVVILDDETAHLVGGDFQTRSLGTVRQGMQMKSREIFILS